MVTIMENEKWVEARINGLSAELYEVSNMGQVRIKEHSITFMRKGKLSVRLCKAHMIKPHDNGLGYQQVNIMVNGQNKAILVHRLVMDSFNPDYDLSLTDIDHLNSDRMNNRLINLQRLTHHDNLVQEHRMKLIRKPVRIISTDHRIQLLFNSVSEAANWMGTSPSQLSHALNHSGKLNGYSVYFKD